MEKHNSRKQMIFIAIPNMGEIRAELVQRLITWSHHDKYDVKIYMPAGMLPLDNARSHCLNRFMEISNDENDRLWFIDADIIPPINAIDVLMQHDRDVCGLLCFMMKPDDKGQMVPLPIALRYNQDRKYQIYWDGDGLTEIDAFGGGCVMTKRKVFERIGGRCYEFHYYPDGLLKLVGDYDFCQKVQAAGFKIYVDFNNQCSHFKTIDLKDINNLMCQVAAQKVSKEIPTYPPAMGS